MYTDNLPIRTRREFLRDSLGLAALAATVPTFLSRTAFALDGAAASPRNDGRVLVIIQLSGGNDGLNTVIPYSDDAYYRLRPSIGIPAKDVVRLNDRVGLHPSLGGFRSMWDAGDLALVQGVGYPNPDRSHFRSLEIWHTATPDDYATTGWLGRYFDHTCANSECSPTGAISVAQAMDPPLVGSSGVGIALRDPESFYKMTQLHERHATGEGSTGGDSQLDFLRRTAMNATLSADTIRKSVRGVKGQADYPRDRFGRDLKLVAAMIAGGLDTRVYYVSLGGFDTHANQAGPHERLLSTLGDGLAAFHKDLKGLGISDRVLGFSFSEFGRRVAQNGTGGTDHGQAAPLFMFGGPVKAGLHGEHPSLTDLNRGDLKYGIDFRRIYATAIRDWLGADPDPILGGAFESLPVFG